ncbi:MAG: hypothetical protein ACXACU_13640 [Candidatus Hodarchaeales archaeon]
MIKNNSFIRKDEVGGATKSKIPLIIDVKPVILNFSISWVAISVISALIPVVFLIIHNHNTDADLIQNRLIKMAIVHQRIKKQIEQR